MVKDKTEAIKQLTTLPRRRKFIGMFRLSRILINKVETHAPNYVGPNSEGPSPKL